VKRTLYIIAVAVWAAVPAASQQSSFQEWSPPLGPVPVEELAGYEWYTAQKDYGFASDLLSEDQIARRLARIYRYQSQILLAQADGDVAGAAKVMRSALDEIDALRDQPAIQENPRFRELYRTIVAEHDLYFGQFMEKDYGEIFALRAAIFVELEKIPDPVVTTSTPPSPRTKPSVAVTPSIDMPNNNAVQRARNFLLSDRREHLIRWMSRAQTYFPLMEQVLAEEGLPDELKYLSVIESALQPRARSTAHAVGLWQFISATGRAYGLQRDGWVDERMDPVKSTRAAARHLKDLYAQYNQNWHVALAGYNCSPRCIKRAVRANRGVMDFWGMYRHLNRETRGYVPMFIAAAQIMSNPGKFGLPETVDGPSFAYDVVPVTGSLTLKTIAGMVGADEATIKNLNPELLRNALPPSAEPYPLRIPPGTASKFVTAFNSLPKEDKPTVREHVVKSRENLGKIGDRYGVTASDIMSANNLRRTIIYPGQRLVIPVAGGVVGAKAQVFAENMRTVDWGQHVNQPIVLSFNPSSKATVPPIAQSSQPKTPTSNTSLRAQSQTRKSTTSSSRTSTTYTVRRGDTLSKIASRYGTTVAGIQRLNGLSGTRIRVGQRLKVDAQTTSSSRANTTHTVRRGESLSRIANRYGTTIASIQRLNGLSGSRILVGQRLKVDAARITHTVRPGENLTQIARKYKTTVSRIRSDNRGINRRGVIQPGQKLTITTR